ncbi:hypothetical protein CK222_26100 [Mesorhizobium sp. WSM3866]|nr:hypothetical protein CK222_26100 [Mesorhizobium sp. WSM3866]PBB58842.1 hypothetical protein CK217_27185 [Mesorhizobium loti]
MIAASARGTDTPAAALEAGCVTDSRHRCRRIIGPIEDDQKVQIRALKRMVLTSTVWMLAI